MPFTSGNGVSLHVQELGEGGPSVVMLHGLLVGNMVSWYFTTAPVLAKRSHVLLYDLRGHGKSERAPSGYDIPSMRGDLEALLPLCKSGPIALVGHSYGAVIALAFAQKFPERVTKLVLVEAPLPPSHLEELDAFWSKSPGEKLDTLPPALRNTLVAQGRQARKFLSSLQFLVRESTLLADLKRAQDIADSELANLRVPVLCVYGTDSSCRPTGERLARVIPDVELVLIPGGHFLPLEAPEPLTHCIDRFLRG